MNPVDVNHGDGPVVLGQPHGGMFVPEDIAARLNDNGLALADTDWHITRLYEGLCPGASVVKVRGRNSCGQGVEGSGFVYAAGRVMTNAHVVAGVREA